MNKKDTVYNKFSLLSVLILIVMIVMVAGLSYAYIIKKIEGGDNTRVIIKTADILLRYDDGDALNAYDVIPGWSDEYHFSIENYSVETNAKYKIKLDVLSALTDEEEENFVYTLESKTNKEINNLNKPLTISESVVPVTSTNLGDVTITAGTLHEYTLKLSLKENNQNQNYLMGNKFIAKVVVEKVF